MVDTATIMGAKSSPSGVNEKGAVARPFPMHPDDREAYLIALSVIAVVKAPEGSLAMIFCATSASAVRL